MTYEEYKTLWASLDDVQRESVRLKAQWEQMTLWAVCRDYPGIWSDASRLRSIEEGWRERGREMTR